VSARPPARLSAWAVDGVGEVEQGTDLVALLEDADLRDGDVVLVTSKVVAKAEGLVRAVDRDTAVRDETVRVVARRGGTRIVENHLGLVMAAGGVDASNVEPGHVVVLPRDPDGSARRLREALRERRDVDVAVVVTDTVGRAWRHGQTDLAIGAAGIDPVDAVPDADGYGNPLVVTAPAVVDELAGLAELVTGKTGGRPFSVVRGLGPRVRPAGDHGPGARVLVRPRGLDMFALGAREAVLAALAGDDADCFGRPAEAAEVVEHLVRLGHPAVAVGDAAVEVSTAPDDRVAQERVRLAAHALAWRVAEPDEGRAGAVRLLPARV